MVLLMEICECVCVYVCVAHAQVQGRGRSSLGKGEPAGECDQRVFGPRKRRATHGGDGWHGCHQTFSHPLGQALSPLPLVSLLVRLVCLGTIVTTLD